MKHYIYKTTNLINGKIYIGKRSHENPEKDKYMGSGTLLRKAFNKYGRQNFKKQILFLFNTEQQAYQKQRQIVTLQFVERGDTYNITCGGYGSWYHTKGMKTVINSKGEILSVPITDDRYSGINHNKVVVRGQNGVNKQISKDEYRSGQYISVSSGKTTFKDSDGNAVQTQINDARVMSGELVGITAGMVVAKDKEGNILSISKDDPRWVSGQLVGLTKGKVVVKDKDGNTFQIDKNDSRYKSGQYTNVNKGISRNAGKTNPNYGKFKDRGLRYIKNVQLQTQKVISISQQIPEGWTIGRLSKRKGRKHTSESKLLLKLNHYDCNGENNSQYGTHWYCNRTLNKNLKLRDGDVIPEGYELGMIRPPVSQQTRQRLSQAKKGNPSKSKGRICINKDNKNKFVYQEQLTDYIISGWKLGMVGT